jgi:hypothetical protein
MSQPLSKCSRMLARLGALCNSRRRFVNEIFVPPTRHAVAAPGKPGSDRNRCQYEFADRALQVRWMLNNTRLENRHGKTRASRL